MKNIEASRTILAPREAVFEVTAHIENYAEVIPNITGVEYLSDQKTGVGARFKETRQMGKRSGTTELEVTEYDPPERVRLVSDQGGTIWDTVYTYEPTEAGTKLTMVMDIRPYKLAARLVTPFVYKVVSKAVESDMDAVKQHCEGT